MCVLLLCKRTKVALIAANAFAARARQKEVAPETGSRSLGCLAHIHTYYILRAYIMRVHLHTTAALLIHTHTNDLRSCHAHNTLILLLPPLPPLTSSLRATDSGESEIRHHLFFRHIDWNRLANREVQPPFRPCIRDRLDVSNFDKQFTQQHVQLSPTDDSIMMNLDQHVFDGFSYTYENFHYNSMNDDDDLLLEAMRDSQNTAHN